MKLSIIIPVYNVERYIADCLHSIMQQDNAGLDLELILINDGTPDNSMQVVEQLGYNTNLRVIHQNNTGQAVARNRGFEEATGDFIWFIDSDDWISPKAFHIISEYLTDELDALTIGLADYQTNGRQVPRMDRKISDSLIKSGKEILLSGQFQMGLPSTIYSRHFFTRYSLKQVEGIYHEDFEFTLRAYYFAQRIKICNDSLYIVRPNPTSTTRRINPKRAFDLLTVAISLHHFFHTSVTDQALFPFYHRYISTALKASLVIYPQLNDEEKKKYQQQFKNHKILVTHLLKSSSMNNKIQGVLMSMSAISYLKVYTFFKQLFTQS